MGEKRVRVLLCYSTTVALLCERVCCTQGEDAILSMSIATLRCGVKGRPAGMGKGEVLTRLDSAGEGEGKGTEGGMTRVHARHVGRKDRQDRQTRTHTRMYRLYHLELRMEVDASI